MGLHKLLLIDSHLDLADTFIKSVNVDEIEIRHALTASEGESLALETIPDVLIIDVNLPDSNGFTLFTSLKKQSDLKDCRFVITGADIPEDTFVNHARLKRHADLYLHKPYKAPTLLQKLNASFGLDITVNEHANEADDPFGLDIQASEDDTLDELDNLLGDVSDTSLMSEEIDDDADLSELDRMLGLDSAPPDLPPAMNMGNDGPPPLPSDEEKTEPQEVEEEIPESTKEDAEPVEEESLVDEIASDTEQTKPAEGEADSSEALLEEIPDDNEEEDELLSELPEDSDDDLMQEIAAEAVDEQPQEETMVIERGYYGENEEDVSTGDVIEAHANSEDVDELEELDELSDDELLKVAEEQPFGEIKERTIGDIPDEPLLGEIDDEEKSVPPEKVIVEDKKEETKAEEPTVADKEQTSKLAAANEILASEIADLKQELKNIQLALTDSEKNAKEKSSKADTFWNEVKQLEEKLKERNNEHSKLKERVKQQFEDIKAAHQAELQSLKGELTHTRDASNANQESLALENTQLKTQFDTLKLENERLTQQIENDNEEHQKHLEEQQRHAEFLEQERKALEEKLAETESVVSDLKTTYENELNELRASFATEKAELKEQSENEKAELNRKLSEAAALNEELEKSKKEEIAELGKELDESEAEKEELERKALNLSNELESLRTTITEKGDEIAALRTEIENKDQEIIDKQVDIESLTAELESIQKQKDALKEEMDSSGKSIEQRIKELNDKLEESERMAAKASKEASDLAMALEEKTDAYESRVFDMEQEINQLRMINTKNEDRVLKAFHKIKADAELRARTEKALTIALQILKSAK